ncbi:LutC/YkgG family protein [Flexivirga aerilata]|uniref:LutC/YkgG family protein n=1 Tax=Flexivirga aerilata TaxID=1656889 RepID=UPI0031B64E7A
MPTESADARRADTDATDPAGRRPKSADAAGLVGLFAERMADYRAEVTVVSADTGINPDTGTGTGTGTDAPNDPDLVTDPAPGAIADAIAAALGDAATVVVPDGVPAQWLSRVTARQVTDAALSPDDLDGIDAVVTGAALGVAVTGTIVLDHGAAQGRRALSLVPDLHVCVVREDQIVHDVPDATAALAAAVCAGRPLTWISGPSATSDIELDRVEGVHGPRTLRVIVLRG